MVGYLRKGRNGAARALESEWFWNPQPRQRVVKGEGGQGGGGGWCELRALGLMEAVEE